MRNKKTILSDNTINDMSMRKLIKKYIENNTSTGTVPTHYDVSNISTDVYYDPKHYVSSTDIYYNGDMDNIISYDKSSDRTIANRFDDNDDITILKDYLTSYLEKSLDNPEECILPLLEKIVDKNYKEKILDLESRIEKLEKQLKEK